MNKIRVGAFGFFFLVFTAVVWASPVPYTGDNINSIFSIDVTGSQFDEMVNQELSQAGCAATVDENLLLHIPYLSFATPIFGTISLSADFVYQSNPAFVIFKLINAGFSILPPLCTTATLSSDFKIHIPDVLLPNGNIHLWLDLEFSPILSTDGNFYFRVTNFGFVL